MRRRLTRNNATLAARERRFARTGPARSSSRRGAPASNSQSCRPADSKSDPTELPDLNRSRPSVPPRDLKTSQYGPLGRLVKWVVSLLLSYHTYHQDLVNASLAASFDQLADNQALLANALMSAGPVEERLVTLERQLDLVRSRLQRIGTTLREHDERIDALGHLVEQLHVSRSDHGRPTLPGGDSILRFSLPSTNGRGGVNLDGAARELATSPAETLEVDEPDSGACSEGREALVDEIHQALTAVRVLRQHIDDATGETARVRAALSGRSARPPRAISRMARRSRRSTL